MPAPWENIIWARRAAVKNLLYLSIGSGFSAGLIAEGKLITGKKQPGRAVRVLFDGPATAWSSPPRGPQDCAEEVLSGYGFLAVTRRLLAEGKLPSRLVDSPRSFHPGHSGRRPGGRTRWPRR